MDGRSWFGRGCFSKLRGRSSHAILVSRVTGRNRKQSYRVTHLVNENLLLTWIWDAPPSCQGSK